MNGKDKCRILKQIRKEIAEKNDIEWIVSECKHKGNCLGTCPKCEAEVRKLENELSHRRRMGLTVSLVGISTLCLTSLTGCSVLKPQINGNMEIVSSTVESLAGEIDTTDIEIVGEIEAPSDTEELDGAMPNEDFTDEGCTDETCTGESNTEDTDVEIIELAGDVPDVTEAK